MAGATNFDKACHRVFDGRNNGTDYLSKDAGVRCGHCGDELQAYYCEERLFLIECQGCGIKALVKASKAKSAAYMTIGAVPAADVAPVVRCRDCEHSYDDIGGRICAYGACVDCVVEDDFYCKDGKRGGKNDQA